MKNIHILSTDKPSRLYLTTKKEELKQETIAEAGQVYLSKVADGKRTTGYADEDFIEGAKWQLQRSYIEEDLKTAFTQGHDYTRDFINQFTDGHLLNELSDKEWTVSRFLLWLEANNFKITKHNGK